MAGRDFGPPPYIVPEFNVIWRNWLNLVYQKIYKRTFTIDLQATNSVSPASNPMVDGVMGIAPVALAGAITNESRHLAFVVPENWISGSDLTVKIRFANISGQAGVKTVITLLAYLPIAAEEVASGTGTTLTDTVSLATGVAANTFHVSADLTIPGSALSLNDTVFLKLTRDAATDTCTGDVGYQSIVIEYSGLLNHE